MRLLLDENLSPPIIDRVDSVWPGSTHVDRVGLRGASDRKVWDWAALHGCVLVSKDSDFRQMSFLYGHPPKVIWLSVGNAGTTVISDLLLQVRERIEEFLRDADEALLVVTDRHE